ncbi:hypothetical protein FOA52_008388 [Chlamydomonas sp. UWO 241]|nr:hypothetical protein FOA52_008388 [Chlamydomonas sp. UWO 241]
MICALLASCSVSCQALPCEAIKLCSAGQMTGPYVGEIDTDAGLVKALERRSFSKEVILLLGSAGTMLLPLLQTIKDFESHGYAHILILAKDAATCATIAGHVPDVGCADSTASLGVSAAAAAAAGQSSAKLDLFHTKWSVAARAVRHGYNVLLLDTDVLQLGDVYGTLKAAPFKDVTMLAQARGGAAGYATATEVDPGVLYIQNADPSGPVSWVLSEAADRFARWAEDGFQTLATKGYTPCGLRSGDMLNDVLASAAAGQLLFYGPVIKCQAKEDAAVKRAMEKAVDWPSREQPATSDGLRIFELKLPSDLSATAELGGSLYPPSRLATSQAVQKALAGACLNCTTEWPLWPDVSGAPTPGKPPLKKETLALLPPWVAGAYEPRAEPGYWGSGQVLGHTQSPDASVRSSALAKAHVRMAYGAYHWDSVVAKVKGGKGVYTTSDDAQHVPIVAAIHPDLLADPTLTRAQFDSLTDSLVQVAQYTRKFAVWPAVPCSLPWVNGSTGWARFPGPDANRTMLCMRETQLGPECMSKGVPSMLPWELERMKEVYRLHRPMDASPEKTLVAGGRANPDYTKALVYTTLQEVPFQDLAHQIVNNVMTLPGSSEPTRVTGQRLHILYIGQAITIKYADPSQPDAYQAVPSFAIKGDPEVWRPSMPDKTPKQLEDAFNALKAKCFPSAGFSTVISGGRS